MFVGVPVHLVPSGADADALYTQPAAHMVALNAFTLHFATPMHVDGIDNPHEQPTDALHFPSLNPTHDGEDGVPSHDGTV